MIEHAVLVTEPPKFKAHFRSKAIPAWLNIPLSPAFSSRPPIPKSCRWSKCMKQPQNGECIDVRWTTGMTERRAASGSARQS